MRVKAVEAPEISKPVSLINQLLSRVRLALRQSDDLEEKEEALALERILLERKALRVGEPAKAA